MQRHVFALTALLVLSMAASSFAGNMLQPFAASSSMGSFSSTYSPTRAIDQSALASPYISGVTNFDTFVPNTKTSGGGGGNVTWYSQQNVLTGNFDFDLGGSFNIESFGLWTDPQNLGQGINSFSLFADDNAGFSSPALLGAYNAANITAETNNFGQVFTFTPTLATHVRMQINSNHGSTFVTGMVETAFETVVPEPGSLALAAIASLGLLRRRVI